MSDAPERIWAWRYTGAKTQGAWSLSKYSYAEAEYTRTDLVPPQEVLAAAILDAQLRCMERGRIDTPDEIQEAAAAFVKEPKP